MIIFTSFTIVFATGMEAGPFIESVNSRQIASEPYPVYHTHIAGQTGLILVSGMGVESAAAATNYIVGHYATDLILNCGVAGCLTGDFAVGDIVSITATAILKSGARLEDIKLVPVTGQRLNGYPEGTLVTVDKPLFDQDRKKALSGLVQLVDMEGGVIAYICRRNNIACQLIKIVSDHAGDRKMLRENLHQVSEILACTLVQDLHKLSRHEVLA